MVCAVSKPILLCFLAVATISTSVVESAPKKKFSKGKGSSGKDNIFDEERLDQVARIVGGENAPAGEYPYYAELGGCGGTVIASDIVLFAAHCAGINFERQISIGGIKNSFSTEGDGKPRFCDQILVDPLYGTGGSSLNYDFALCKLSSPIENFNEGNVRLVMNDKSNFPANGGDLTVAGFGLEQAGGGGLTQDLKHVVVKYVGNNKCQQQYKNWLISDQMLCAGVDEGQKDACSGDSGGPLVSKSYDKNTDIETHTHVGVVSWGVGCGHPDYPGVYARTSSRIGWIRNAMCNTLRSQDPSCGPNPPPKCPGQAKVTIRIEHDNWGEETAWTMYDSNGKKLMYREYRMDNVVTSQDICVDYEEEFEWTITDTYGDGSGPYSIFLNDVSIVQTNGRFGSAETRYIESGSATQPSQSPSLTPTITESTAPTVTASGSPSAAPSLTPSVIHSGSPTVTGSGSPTGSETSSTPTIYASSSPSASPSSSPSASPSSSPSSSPSASPSASPAASLITSSENCHDLVLAFKNQEKFNCEKMMQKGKGKQNKLIKICNKEWEGKTLRNYWCRESCGNWINGGQCFEEEDPSKFDEMPTNGTEDNDDFRWKGKEELTCQNWLSEKRNKRCAKYHQGYSVSDVWCPATCSIPLD